MRVAVFISGNGSNLQAIIDATANKWLDIELVGVISNKNDALGLKRAEKAGIPTLALGNKKLSTFEEIAKKQLDEWQVDLLVLAGFMRVLSADFIDAFEGVMINIHPSLLPKYKGLHTHKRVLEAKDSLHGCSVHFVTSELDSGKVIAQNCFMISDEDTETSLATKISPLEHALLPRVIGWIAEHRFYIADNTLFLDGFPLKKPLTFFELAN